MYMGLIYNKINHTKIENAFVFNAFYSAITFGILFVVNDYIDQYIMPTLENDFHYKSATKLIVHILIIFIVTLIITFIMWLLFGWGRALAA